METNSWGKVWEQVALWSPIVPLPEWLAPAVALGSLLALLILSGIALGSLGVLLTSLLVAHLLLERVFGITLAVR